MTRARLLGVSLLTTLVLAVSGVVLGPRVARQARLRSWLAKLDDKDAQARERARHELLRLAPADRRELYPRVLVSAFVDRFQPGMTVVTTGPLDGGPGKYTSSFMASYWGDLREVLEGPPPTTNGKTLRVFGDDGHPEILFHSQVEPIPEASVPCPDFVGPDGSYLVVLTRTPRGQQHAFLVAALDPEGRALALVRDFLATRR